MMKVLAGFFLAIGIAAPLPIGAAEAALPSDSIYQLPLQLTDQHGKSWDWRSRRGKPQVVAMFYASCRYICPLIIEGGKAVDRSLTPAQRAGLGMVYISMDPERDTPTALAKLAKERKVTDKRWALASPRAEDVRSVAGVLGVRYRQLSDGEFNHTSALVLLDADGRILARTEKIGSQPDPEFIAAVRKAL
ncbi:MAG: SCO family protein [Pseudomonadota bacterium]|nr:SCO family protein [Pseudomonadota bacterium]